MRKSVLITIIAICIVTASANANIIRIPQDFPTIQGGIDFASVGDTVLVAPGTYTDTHESFLNGFPIPVCVSLRSGIVVMSEMGPDFTTITNDTVAAIIFIANVEDTTSILKGFRIQGIFWGILCVNISDPLIEDNNIISSMLGEGLGVAVGDSSSPLIRNNLIQDWEGGALMEGASPTFVNNLFELNEYGIKIESSSQFDSSTPIIHQNLFRNQMYNAVDISTDEADVLLSENIFDNNGTGLYLYPGRALVKKNIFANNEYGVEAFYKSEAILINNTFWGNSTGFLATVDSQETYQIYNTIIWNSAIPISIDTSFFFGTLIVNYSDIQGGWSGIGNKDADPLFVHPDTLNFQLEENSPCVDTGIDTIFTIQGDTIVNSDFQGNKPDMGAIESPWITSINSGGSGILDHFMLYPNYPNPFNPSTTINYRLPERSKVVLKIYNILGEEIKTLVNNYETAGLKSVVWDGLDSAGNQVSSGIYLYRIQVENFVETKRAVLIK